MELKKWKKKIKKRQKGWRKKQQKNQKTKRQFPTKKTSFIIFFFKGWKVEIINKKTKETKAIP